MVVWGAIISQLTTAKVGIHPLGMNAAATGGEEDGDDQLWRGCSGAIAGATARTSGPASKGWRATRNAGKSKSRAPQ